MEANSKKILALSFVLVLNIVHVLSRDVAIIPHDTHPGSNIKKFTSDNTYNYRLLENGYSDFFTMLEDGSVMTTSNLTPLLNRPVSLVVLEETPNTTSTHTLHLYVLDRRHILKFAACEKECIGSIPENRETGTNVDGIPMLQAIIDGQILNPATYSIISGNENGAFQLQHFESNEINENITDESNSGVFLITSKALDREEKSSYLLIIQAADQFGVNKATTRILVNVEDENDNSPIFTEKNYRFIIGDDLYDAMNVTLPLKRFSSIGKVEAIDNDGDKVAYRLLTINNLVVIVPQTGELLLIEEPTQEIQREFTVEAHDLRTPSRKSLRPANVFFHYKPQEKIEMDNEIREMEDKELHRDKRRVTRAVRPTKRIEFTESDGDSEGRNVFQLEKETDRETFKIRDENAWVTVEPNGAVRVKKKWDYEELGPEKTIDFWVTITNAGNGGKSLILLLRLVNYYRNCPTTDKLLRNL